LIFDHAKIPVVNRDGAVCIAIHYRLVGPGIQFQWVRDFQQNFRPALEPAHFPVQWVVCRPSFPTIKRLRKALTTHPI